MSIQERQDEAAGYPHIELHECGRKLDGPYRCPCTYEQPTPPASKPWTVTRDGVVVRCASEMMARADAERFGGTLEINGRMVGYWPRPAWVQKLYDVGRAAASAPRRPGSPGVVTRG